MTTTNNESELLARARTFNDSLHDEVGMGPLTKFVLAAHSRANDNEEFAKDGNLVRDQLHNLKALMLQKWKQCAQLLADVVELNRSSEELQQEVAFSRACLMNLDDRIAKAERDVR